MSLSSHHITCYFISVRHDFLLRHDEVSSVYWISSRVVITKCSNNHKQPSFDRKSTKHANHCFIPLFSSVDDTKWWTILEDGPYSRMDHIDLGWTKRRHSTTSASILSVTRSRPRSNFTVRLADCSTALYTSAADWIFFPLISNITSPGRIPPLEYGSHVQISERSVGTFWRFEGVRRRAGGRASEGEAR